jgi:hypothetical protein
MFNSALTPEEIKVAHQRLKDAGSTDRNVAAKAQAELAVAAEGPIRETLLSGDIINGIYVPKDFRNNARVEFWLDLLTPGDETGHYAYVVPSHGRIPERRVESDYLMVPTYSIGSSIDGLLRYLRDANWDVVGRMIQVLEAGFVKKMNDDGWATLMAAALDRNIMISDPNAVTGQFTPRLITLMKTFMRRNGGGNSATLNRSRLTDIFVSPEAVDDIRSWNLDLIPDEIRARIFDSSDGTGDMINIYNTNIHALDEFGEGQEYQTYFTSSSGLSGSMTAGDLEIGVGLDLQNKDLTFVMPVREDLSIWEDNTLHRGGTFGFYGRAELGFSVLDSRKTLLLSM